MLHSENRFHGHGSLRYLHKNSSTVRSRLMTIRYTPNIRRSTPRIAVVISKKVHKSAVGRNRARRRLYEIIRHEFGNFNGVYDIAVFVTSAEVIMVPHDELLGAVRELLHQARLITQ